MPVMADRPALPAVFAIVSTALQAEHCSDTERKKKGKKK
jgi:hypothetical protein